MINKQEIKEAVDASSIIRIYAENIVDKNEKQTVLMFLSKIDRVLNFADMFYNICSREKDDQLHEAIFYTNRTENEILKQIKKM